MKKAWGFLVVLGLVVTLLSAVQIPSQVAMWRDLAQSAAGKVPPEAVSAVPILLAYVWLACLAISVVFVTSVMVRLLKAQSPFFYLAKARVKGWFGVGEWISEKEAMAIVEASDFFTVRSQRGAANNVFGDMAKSIFGQTQSRKDRIIEQRFLKRVLSSFAEQRQKGVSEAGYDKAALREWLEALIDREVDEEMGAIPSV